MKHFLTLLVLCLAPGCSYHVLSPPARAAPLESPRTLPVGQNAIAVEGAAQSGVFDPTIVSGALRYRRGLTKRLDGVADMTAFHVLGRPSDLKTWPGAYALRLGVKQEASRDVFALTFGLGAGGSAAGGFISPDLGFILGYENRYFVPFLSVRAFISQPLGARRVVLGEEDGERRASTPATTLGAGGALGFRIPLLHDKQLTHSLAIGLAATGLCDKDTCGFWAGLALNFEGIYALETGAPEVSEDPHE